MPRFGSLRGKKIRKTTVANIRAKKELALAQSSVERALSEKTTEEKYRDHAQTRFNEAYDHGMPLHELRESGYLQSLKAANARQLLKELQHGFSKINLDIKMEQAMKAKQAANQASRFRQSKIGKAIRLATGGPNLWKRTNAIRQARKSKK